MNQREEKQMNLGKKDFSKTPAEKAEEVRRGAYDFEGVPVAWRHYSSFQTDIPVSMTQVDWDLDCEWEKQYRERYNVDVTFFTGSSSKYCDVFEDS